MNREHFLAAKLLALAENHGKRGAKFVGGVRREALPLLDVFLEVGEGFIEHSGEVAQFTSGTGVIDAAGKVAVTAGVIPFADTSETRIYRFSESLAN